MTDTRIEGDTDVDVFESNDASEPTRADPRWVALPPAGMLSIEDADTLLRRRDASLIGV